MDTNIEIKTEKPPRVTVLMPVFNGANHLREAIDSILKQTFADFEFLIINDGSTDRSADIVGSYRDHRITLLHNPENLGLIATLNKGIALARGEYIARMDCDDVSLPRRLEKQVIFMDKNPGIGVCGTWFRTIGDSKAIASRPATDLDMIRCGFLFNSMLGHPTVTIRSRLFKEHKLAYNPESRHAEDFDLWVRALQYCDIANIGEILLHYRSHDLQVTRRFVDERAPVTYEIRRNQLAALGLQVQDEEMEFHQSLCIGDFRASRNLLAKADKWLCRIKDANDARRLYPEPAFSKILLERWFVLCYKTMEQGLIMPKLFLTPKLLTKTQLGGTYTFRFLAGSARNLISDRIFRG